jgi:hypothetical protein
MWDLPDTYKRATEDLENLKITQLSWKNISKFTVASGFSQTQLAPELNTSFSGKLHCTPLMACASPTLMAKAD